MGPPPYIYKIVPASTPPPSPLPQSLPVSPLDAKDNFIHCSTSSQLLGTLKRFFAADESVYILRIPYAHVKEQGVVRWEFTDGRQGSENEEGCFAHLYNGLKVGRDEVDSVGEWKKGSDGWSADGWPFIQVDVPSSSN